MKINGRKSTQPVGPVGPFGAPAPTPAESGEVAKASDQVSLTSTQKLRELNAQVQAMPDVRMEKVEGLKDAIEEGSYHVESDKLARKVVDEALNEALMAQQRFSSE